LLEDGQLTDAKGRSVSFRNTIIIMTSNLGADEMMKESSLGFSTGKSHELDTLHARNARTARKALEKFMRPELINRLDGIITFRSLTRKEVGVIFDLLIKELGERLVRKGLGVSVTSAAKRSLITKGYSAKFGARPLRRVIEDDVEHMIAEGILDGSYQKGAILEIDIEKGALKVNDNKERVVLSGK
jgi:ATP-dependent Clp protease ATP-binding subunit ClpC